MNVNQEAQRNKGVGKADL